MNPTFGEIVRQRRKELKFNLAQACREVGRIHPPYLSRIEREQATPSEALVRRMAKVYGLDEEELVFRARRIHKQLDELKRKFPRMTGRWLKDSK